MHACMHTMHGCMHAYIHTCMRAFYSNSAVFVLLIPTKSENKFEKEIKVCSLTTEIFIVSMILFNIVLNFNHVLRVVYADYEGPFRCFMN